MRQAAIIFGAAVAGILLLAMALPSLLDANHYRGQLQAQAEAALHRAVSLGPIKLSLLPPSLRAQHLMIAEDAAFPSGRPFATADDLKVSLGLFALLTGKIAVESVELKNPVVELVRNAGGAWNYSTLAGGACHCRHRRLCGWHHRLRVALGLPAFQRPNIGAVS